MYTHPEIHSQLARQRQADVHRRLRPPLRRARTPEASLDDLGPLVQAARAGDREAWDLLVTHFTPRLRSVVRGYGLSNADADDVVQVTWVAAYTHIRRLRMPEAFGGWLMVTARHAAVRALERGRREIAVDDEQLPHEVTDGTPESALLEAEERNAVHAAIERLPEHQRVIVRTLVRHPTTTYADLAEKLGIPVGSIGPTRDRALARLRRDDQLIAAV
jgi:RNA polymerase sigma factor (sigma-70 family)